MEDFFDQHHYQLVKLLREGLQYQCYLAKNLIDEELYQIEYIPNSLMPKQQIQIMMGQLEKLQNLNHTNILQFKQSFYDANYGLSIVLEYLGEGNLQKKIKQQKQAFSQEQIVTWLWQLCLGLNYLHENEIIHGKITTQNIFIPNQGNIKLGCFIHSQIMNFNRYRSQQLIENAQYKPPQILQGKQYTNKSDVWCLGVCMYQICCLKRPFQFNKISTKIKGSIPVISYKYSKKLRNTVYEMLDYSSQKRPSVEQLLGKPIFSQYRFQLLKIASFRSVKQINLQKVQIFKQKLLKNSKNNNIRNQLTFKSKKNVIKCIVSTKNMDNLNPSITPKYIQYPKTNRLDSKVKNTFTPPLKKCLKSLSTVVPISNKKNGTSTSQKTKKNFSVTNKCISNNKNQVKIEQVKTSQTTKKSPKLARSRCKSSHTYDSNYRNNTFRQNISIYSEEDVIQDQIQSIQKLIIDKIGNDKFKLMAKLIEENMGFCSTSDELTGLFSLWYGLKINNCVQNL